jgi:hypothetical protein
VRNTLTIRPSKYLTTVHQPGSEVASILRTIYGKPDFLMSTDKENWKSEQLNQTTGCTYFPKG